MLNHTAHLASPVLCVLMLSALIYDTKPAPAAPDAVLSPPREEATALRILSPTIIEVSWFTKSIGQEPNSVAPLSTTNLIIRSGTEKCAVTRVGVKRHAAHAPLKTPGLLLVNNMYIELDAGLQDGASVRVSVDGKRAWPGRSILQAIVDPLRWNPAIHVNQTGYLPSEQKIALVGFYLGTLGELRVQANAAFRVLNENGEAVFQGNLKPRPDDGFPYPAYQQVLEADFTPLKESGRYRLQVAGLGTSFSFSIGEEYPAVLARTYALGLYHQRCGTGNALPYTRFTHGPCHLKQASVPISSALQAFCNWTLNTENETRDQESRQTAPLLRSINSSLYPFVNRGPLDVHGGHHDAGDYSKYTINSAAFIHLLITACDVLPGVVELDNLGVPESGDGKGDILQEAKWEADFLARMQDSDGGFYFLVYPQNRRYESDVTPDHGDPQLVFPKNTAATAAAVAALAQCASSPQFKKQFPESVPAYLEKAVKGWSFLTKAIAKHGKDGAYQRITHYGDQFMHDDELAWAATELLLATGGTNYADKVSEWFKPENPEMRKWGWWRLYDAQGCATRSYGLAVQSGRTNAGRLDPALLAACKRELIAAADEQADRASKSAYGTSFPTETKQARSAGWYFSPDAAFDMAVGAQVASGDQVRLRTYLQAILSNFNYEQGCNPVNVCYLTGLGAKRQYEVVHQYAQNDRRVLPPIGIPLGNIQGGISWVEPYRDLPDKLALPKYEDEAVPYPFYDRWSDAFNLSQEFVILNQARGLSVAAWLMARTPLKIQQWKPVAATITGLSTRPKAGQASNLQLTASNVDLSHATVLWETPESATLGAPAYQWRSSRSGQSWVEAEAMLPDGRRVFADTELK